MTFEWLDRNRFRQDPRDPDFFQNPYRLYRRLHERGGAVYWEDYALWCLVDFESVDACLRDRRFARVPPSGQLTQAYPSHLADFANAELYSLLASKPPAHTRLRRFVNRAFVSRKVEEMTGDIERLAHTCIDNFIDDGHAELLSQYVTPIPVIVIARLLGVPEQETDDLLRWSHAMVKVYTKTQTVAEEHDANRAAREFMRRIQELIVAKRVRPDNDLLSHLVQLQDSDDGPTDHEICSIAILLLNAGHEATVHQLGNCIVSLLQARDGGALSENLRDADSLSKWLDECLRFDPPLHLFTRYAQEDVVLAGGVPVSAGTEVGLLLGAANRCPARFTQADQFSASREDGGMVTFGAGVHFCVGTALAKMELRVAVSVLLQRLPDLRLACVPVYRDSFHFHGYESLEVTW